MVANLTPTILDLRWGPNQHERVDILKHPTRDPAGNPVLFFRHGGGNAGGDKKQPWVSAFDVNALFQYVSTQTSMHFDLMSVESEQSSWGTPTSLAGHPLSGTAYDRVEKRTRPCHYPDAFFAMPRFVQWLKTYAKGRAKLPALGHVDLDTSPSDIIAFGDSFGANCCTLLGVTEPRVGTVYPDANNEFGPFQWDSTVKGIINFRGPPDYRSKGNPTVIADEIIDWTVPSEYYGTPSFAEWSAVSQDIKAKISLNHYLDQTTVQFWTNMFVIFENVGTGVTPYANPHDGAQWAPLVAKIAGRGLEHDSRFIANGEWISNPNPINAQIFTWMQGCLEV